MPGRRCWAMSSNQTGPRPTRPINTAGNGPDESRGRPPGRSVRNRVSHSNPGRSARIERDVAPRVFRPDVPGAPTNQTVVGVLLQHVSGPSRYTAHGKDRREQIHVDAERVIRGRRVEI